MNKFLTRLRRFWFTVLGVQGEFDRLEKELHESWRTLDEKAEAGDLNTLSNEIDQIKMDKVDLDDFVELREEVEKWMGEMESD